MKCPMRALAITGMLTAAWMPTIISGSDIRATPPSRRMSAGTRSSAITAAAPACSAIFACTEVTTSMITPPLSISARPAFTVNVASSRLMPFCSLSAWECSRAIPRAAMSATASMAAVFIHDGDTFEATELARGPWSPDSQHGGAPAALLMRGFEGLDGSGLAIARVTYEFIRPVPLGHLHVDVEVVRPGRRVQLMEGAIRTPGGTEVVRARALRVMPADPDAPRTAEPPPPPGPEGGVENDYV